MQVSGLEQEGLCYEDYLPAEGSLENWPLVGTWVKVHFMLQLFSSVGERLLGMLGIRAHDWLVVRATSSAVRFGLYGALADWLRSGPEALRYQGAQWLSEVEGFCCMVRQKPARGCRKQSRWRMSCLVFPMWSGLRDSRFITCGVSLC